MDTIERVRTVGFAAPSRTEEMERSRAAVAAVLPFLTDLVGTIRKPDAIAVGSWRVADVAAHLSHVTLGEQMVATTIGGRHLGGLPVGDDLVAGAAGFNTATLEGDPERDPAALAGRIQKDATALIDHLAPFRGDEPVGWLGGLVLPSSALLCHLLGEYLVHGYDIARAEGRPWHLDKEAAALGFGFLLDAMRSSPSEMKRCFVDGSHRDAKVCFEIRVRGGGRAYLDFRDGVVDVSDTKTRSSDCHLSGDPRALLLLAFDRVTPLSRALTGGVIAWGRKPWLALHLSELLRNP